MTTPAPSLVSFVDSRSGSATGTSIAVDRPATAAGQVTLLGFSSRGKPTMTAPAGWNLVRIDDNATTMRQWVFSKVSTTATPAGTDTFKLSSSQSAAWTTATYAGVLPDEPGGCLRRLGQRGVEVHDRSPGSAGRAASTAVSFAGVAVASSITPGERLDRARRVLDPDDATYKITGELADVTVPASGQVAVDHGHLERVGGQHRPDRRPEPARRRPPPPTSRRRRRASRWPRA